MAGLRVASACTKQENDPGGSALPADDPSSSPGREQVEEQRARELLRSEREQIERLLGEVGRRDAVREAGDEHADRDDGAQPLTADEADETVASGLRARLGAISRAEARLDAGTYGRSVKSGEPIPDERLEADPAAELTVGEAAAARR